MKECVRQLIGSFDLFKDWRAKLSSPVKYTINDEEILEALQ